MRYLACSLFLFACAGDAPKGIDPTVDAATDAPPAASVGQRVSGKAMDYFGAVALPEATVTTDGIDPQMTATSAADGAWALADVPTGSKVFLSVTHTSYRPTRNVATTVVDTAVVQDVYVMSVADVTRQYTTLGVPPAAGKAFLAAELQLDNGSPIEGIPLANVVLVDALNQPVPDVLGPVFFGAAGDIDPALLAATAFTGRSRVAFLDLPPGTYTLKVTFPNGAAGDKTVSTSVTATADGAVLGLAGGLVPGGPGGNVLDPKFEGEIYPRLQKAALGGLGCANCHTLGGPGAVIKFDDPAATVLANLLPAAPGGRIDTVTPADSLLLTKPLYELAPLPQNHPNATFLDINDPDYKLFLLWITNGAKP